MCSPARSPAACTAPRPAQITVLVGGDKAVFEKHRGALAGDGRRGRSTWAAMRTASVTKVVTNMLAFIHLIAAGEALMLCKNGGVDLGTGLPRHQGQLRQQLRP